MKIREMKENDSDGQHAGDKLKPFDYAIDVERESSTNKSLFLSETINKQNIDETFDSVKKKLKGKQRKSGLDDLDSNEGINDESEDPFKSPIQSPQSPVETTQLTNKQQNTVAFGTLEKKKKKKPLVQNDDE